MPNPSRRQSFQCSTLLPWATARSVWTSPTKAKTTVSRSTHGSSTLSKHSTPTKAQLPKEDGRICGQGEGYAGRHRLFWAPGSQRIWAESGSRSASMRQRWNRLATTCLVPHCLMQTSGSTLPRAARPTRWTRRVSPRRASSATRWVHLLAREKGYFAGSRTRKATSRHHRVQSDMWNAMGWNVGKRRLTKALDARAWWWLDTQSEHDLLRDPLAIELEDQFGTQEAGFTLLRAIRKHHPLGHIPCQLHPGEARHIYQVNGWNSLRLRCGNKDCKHKLFSNTIWNYLASFFKRKPRSVLDDIVIVRSRARLVVEIPISTRVLRRTRDARRPTRRGRFVAPNDTDDSDLYEDDEDDNYRD